MNKLYDIPKIGIAVDGGCLNNPGYAEYRGIDLCTGKVVFHTKIGYATNNIAEFLAVCQALIYTQTIGVKTIIYTDSRTAISWFKNKRHNSAFKRQLNEQAFELMDECVKWLHNNKKTNFVVWWDKWKFGEIPADFGRKK